MPSGVYQHKKLSERDEETRKKIEACLSKGRSPEVREKVTKILKKNAENPKWREKVSIATKQAMRSPEVREKHLAGLEKARETHGVNFKGGNGQEMTPIIQLANRLLSRCGYIREYPIPTKPVKDKFKNAATANKVDFGNPADKIAIELDGASHHNQVARETDKKKDEILKALGWTVIRLRH